MRLLLQIVIPCISFFILPLTAATFNVRAGDSLQAILNTALPGDVITIEAGATFVGNFKLPNKGGAGKIVIQSSEMSSLPNGRVRPAHAVHMPKLVTPNTAAPLATAIGAHDYEISGIEMTTVPNIYVWTMLQLGAGTEKTTAELPYNITVDRCYIHGDPAVGGKRGVGLNGRSTSLTNSWVSNFKSRNQDTQAVGGINGPGPFRIINNYLESTGENIMFGGATPAITGLVPSDITIRRNTLSKPLSWKPGTPGFQGTTWLVKNHFELKNGRRVIFDGNLLENCWEGGQNGSSILLTVRTENGNAPWAAVEDVQITNNIIRNINVGVTAHERDTTGGTTRGIVVRNNIFEDIDIGQRGGTGNFILLSGAIPGLVIEHNTLLPPKYGMYFTGSRVSPGVIFRNNIITAPICADNLGCGIKAINASGSNAVFAGNLFVGLSSTSYPANNRFPPTVSDIDFTNAAASDYTLASSSPYQNTATDGTDPGVNMAALRAASNVNAPSVTLVLTPTSASLTQNQTLQFAGTVIGSTNAAVIWTRTPAIGTLSTSGLYTAPGSIATTQKVTVVATSVADPGKTGVAVITLNPPAAPSSGASGAASYLKSDTATSGSWKGVYGADGFLIANNSADYPPYGTASITGAALHTWAADSSEPRALQKGSGSGRIASAWHSSAPFNVNLNFTDGKPHRVAVYSMDYSNYGRKQTIDVVDGATGAILNHQTVSSFGNGVYHVWEIRGRVILRVTNVGPINAVVNGVFFGSPSTSPSSSAQIADTKTGGSWKGVYGGAGFTIVNDTKSLPSYATVTAIGGEPHLWAADTSELRALQKGSGSGRIASAWHGSQFDLKVNLTDGKAHKLALYCLDYTNYRRVQRIELINATTGAVLNTQTISDFSNGVYLVWNVTGNIILRVTNAGPINAVMSGLFID